MKETWVRSLGWEDLLKKGTATHSSILAWRIPWTIQSMGSQRVGHDLSGFHFHYYVLDLSKAWGHDSEQKSLPSWTMCSDGG